MNTEQTEQRPNIPVAGTPPPTPPAPTPGTDRLVTPGTTTPAGIESPQPAETKKEVPTPKPKKVFSRADALSTIHIDVVNLHLYPDYEPWGFDLRMKLGTDAEERRQVYMSLTPYQQTIQEDEQQLDELCDLLQNAPTGFGDLKDLGNGPGPSFKSYVQTSEPHEKNFLYTIIRGAMTLYWRKISPQEFRSEV